MSTTGTSLDRLDWPHQTPIMWLAWSLLAAAPAFAAGGDAPLVAQEPGPSDPQAVPTLDLPASTEQGDHPGSESGAGRASSPPSQTEQAGNGLWLSGEEVFSALVTVASSEVDARAQARETQFFQTLGLVAGAIVAVFGVVGYRSIRDLRRRAVNEVAAEVISSRDVETMIESAVEKRLTTEVETKLRVLNQEIAFLRLMNIADGIDRADSFGVQERNAVLNALKELRDNADLTGRSDFLVVLEKVCDRFNDTWLTDKLDEIYALYEDDILEHRGTLLTFLWHYSWRLIGEVSPSNLARERFDRIVRTVNGIQEREQTLPYLLTLEHAHQESGWEVRVAAMMEDVQHLEEEDKVFLAERIRAEANLGSDTGPVSGVEARIQGAFRAMLDACDEELLRRGVQVREDQQPK